MIWHPGLQIWTPPRREPQRRVILPDEVRCPARDPFVRVDEWPRQQAMPYIDSYRFGSPAFVASGYPGYTAEYDAEKETFTTSAFSVAATADNDPVGGWKDQNGNTYPVSNANSAHRATLHTGGPGGHKYVQGNGSSSCLRFDGGMSLAPTNTLYVVIRTDTWASFVTAFGRYGCAGIILYDASPEYCAAAGNTVPQANELAVGTWGVVYATFLNNAGTVRINKNTVHSGDCGSSQTTWNAICLFGSSTYNFGGADQFFSAVSIARALYYHAGHSDADRDAIIDGLMLEYGIS